MADKLSREIIDLSCRGLVLFCEWEDGRDTCIEQKDLRKRQQGPLLTVHLPMPESKLGTAAASVMIINWIVFCHSDH